MTGLPAPSWASAIQTPEESGPPQSILMYGVPGTRKTTISATIAQVKGYDKVLFIDIDNGTEVLALDAEFANIDILKIDPLDPGAKAKLDAVIADVCANDYGYKAIVLDTFDVAQDVVERALKIKHAGNKNTFAVYGELGEWSDDTIRKLHNAPHFLAIITAHSQEKQLDSGALRITPRLSGASKDSIGGIPSLVAYLSFQDHPETHERHLMAVIGESETMITKNRYRLPQGIVDLTMPVLFGMIEEKIKSKKPQATAVASKPAPVAA